MNPHKIKSIVTLYLQTVVILLIVVSCSKIDDPGPSKPDPELARRDSITSLLTNAMNADSIKSYA
jgi:hypothetical protein